MIPTLEPNYDILKRLLQFSTLLNAFFWKNHYYILNKNDEFVHELLLHFFFFNGKGIRNTEILWY